MASIWRMSLFYSHRIQLSAWNASSKRLNLSGHSWRKRFQSAKAPLLVGRGMRTGIPSVWIIAAFLHLQQSSVKWEVALLFTPFSFNPLLALFFTSVSLPSTSSLTSPHLSLSLCSSHSHSHTFQMCHNSFLPLPSLSLAQDWPLELLVQHASVTTLVVLQPAPYCPPPVPPLIHLLKCLQSILYATQI